MSQKYAHYIVGALAMLLVVGLFPRQYFITAGVPERHVGWMVAAVAAAVAGVTGHYVKRWLNDNDGQD